MPNQLQKTEISLEPLPPEEAIKFFKDKVIIPAKEFYDLESWARARAFTVSHVTKAEVLIDIHEAINIAIEEGMTLSDFRAGLKDIAVQRGWVGTNPWHENNIFRTNIQTAYSKGRWDQMEPMQDKFMGQFNAVMDDRTTEVCSDLNGKIYPLDSPFWNVYMPPNHFQCRSAVIPIYISEIERKGLEVQSGITEVLHKPGKGFDVNPAKVPYIPDLSGMPGGLREMVERDLVSARITIST